jgi:hypothetical protein
MVADNGPMYSYVDIPLQICRKNTERVKYGFTFLLFKSEIRMLNIFYQFNNTAVLVTASTTFSQLLQTNTILSTFLKTISL